MQRSAVLPLFCLLFAAGIALAQGGGFETSQDTRRAMASAQTEGLAAQRRAEALELQAAGAVAAADKTAAEAAALAARIQQQQATIAGTEAQARLVAGQRADLRAALAAKQEPLVRLTAALQRLSRRPVLLSLLRPGSVRDTVYLRAALEAMLPEIDRRTAALRGELARGRALEAQALGTARVLRGQQGELASRRQALVGIEARQRLTSRTMSGSADREAERALGLAEQAKDLGALVGTLDAAGALRQELAALPGPVLRPETPGAAPVQIAVPGESPSAPGGFILPLNGRIVTGFGDPGAGGIRSRGLTLAPRAGAQAVAPAAGRVAFAGPYRGYGNIVIVEHPGGWTTLITGLVQLDTAVGANLVAGSPLGLASPTNPKVTIEVRRGGEPVNPLEVMRAG